MKGYNKKIGDVYIVPLPYEIKALPPLIPHNPVSIVMYLWALLVSPASRQYVHHGTILKANKSDMPTGVAVYDPQSALSLWQQGFFGKGTLSRSEPSWFGRTARRLGLDGGELSLEEITEMRRAKRRQFKRERELQQQLELQERRRREGIEEPVNEDAEPVIEEGSIPVRQEEADLVRGDTILRLEYLHLHPCEAVFLKFGMGVLEISDATNTDLLQMLHGRSMHQWHVYVAYHYFRQLGYCARSGVKFGVDWLIYRRGPPFQHAEFAVVVMDRNAEPSSWAWLHSNMRVVGGAKKTLCLLHVEGPSELPDLSCMDTPQGFRAELAKYSVKVFTYTRYAPSRNRD